mmetsp:Transcript_17083/g.23484  ORF Transcript_17083/g.23484 Transcript_17083/m.23484 type:complete len:249 (-) Transcript_17083:126-872(-)|eukprot:CAMPEP_0170058578 /NCGR_PEP_ID=MMETSP0019_2-20121128/1153_1 /TAXON_ID=98059 /ORGANISM="Dinobryon sp., Strain UTEXLB2267" /LENGTH=248 /DNA_ID=CAMNT_0010263563 /DNA_START=27 /DNA_END=773 /DNA_ORIENTATION=-
MAPKKGKPASKKKIVRTSTEDEDLQINQIDVHYNPEIVSSLLHDLSLQIESKCNQIQKDSDFMITSIQQAFHLELIKLPSQVKQMSIREFKEEYGGDILNVTKGYTQPTAKSTKNSNILTNSTKTNIQKDNQKVFQTPNAMHKKSKSGGITALRNPREGEIILSANGSPLGEFATVKKVPQNGSKIDSFAVPQTPGVFLPLRNGNIIDLDSVDIQSLSKEEKEDIQTYLRTVSKNIEGIASKLKLQSS